MYTEVDTKPSMRVLLIGGQECGERYKVSVDINEWGEFTPRKGIIQVYEDFKLLAYTQEPCNDTYNVYTYVLGSVYHTKSGLTYYYALSTLTQNEKKVLLVKYFNFIK